MLSKNTESLAKQSFEIAQRMERGIRTIEREIARGMVRLLNSNLTYREEYCADAGQRIYQEYARNKGPSLKIANDHKLIKYIEKRLLKKSSHLMQ